MISIAALRDVLTAFKAKEMPSDAEIKASFVRDMTILQSRQRDDGSFGLWQRDRERYEYPFLTVHVAHALALAKAKGYGVPTEVIPTDKKPAKPVADFSSRSFGGSWWLRQNWFEHQNFRDDRAEAFASLLWEGVYTYSYVARATTPGQFIVPPAKAEEMYHPETFGRTGTDFLRVE